MLRESLRGKRTEEKKPNTEHRKEMDQERKLDRKGRVGMFFSQRGNETEMSLCDELAICKDGRTDSSGIN